MTGWPFQDARLFVAPCRSGSEMSGSTSGMVRVGGSSADRSGVTSGLTGLFTMPCGGVGSFGQRCAVADRTLSEVAASGGDRDGSDANDDDCGSR